MTKLLGLPLAVIFSVGCSSKRIEECDAFVRTAEKIEKCDKLDPESRAQVKSAVKTMKDALKALDDLGGADSAPKAQLDMLKGMCRKQDESIRATYSKLAPECVK